MSEIPAFPYALLWGERELRSVANLTRADGEDFFSLLQQANSAPDDLRYGRVRGAAVLLP